MTASGTTYEIGDIANVWDIRMFSAVISAQSAPEPLAVDVAAYRDGKIVDPRGATVEFNFKQTGGAPSAAWVAGTWDVTPNGTYVALVQIGASGVVTLGRGDWYAWLRITDAFTSEVIARMCGRVKVTS